MRLFRATFSISARPSHHDSVDWHIDSHLYTIMHKTLIAAILFLASYTTSLSQQLEFIHIPMSGYTIYQGEERLSMFKIMTLMAPNPAAYKSMNACRNLRMLSGVFGLVGGGFIGYPLGTAVGGGDPNWNLLAIGFAVVGVGVPFSIKARKKAEEAVNLWNSGAQSRTPSRQSYYYAIGDGNGLGLGIRF